MQNSTAELDENAVDLQAIRNYLLELQDRITLSLEAYEKELRFLEDNWVREGGGGGRSRVLEGKDAFEKAGVNFSDICGSSLPESATQARPHLGGKGFRAMGVSVVIHPVNPYVPTSHMNVRFFQTTGPQTSPVWWFGGGFDLTPTYGFKEDAVYWHEISRDACSEFGAMFYPRFKSACDRYFFIKHRNECRGVGGLLFDDFNELGFEQSFAFTRSIGDSFLKAYLPIVDRRRDQPYGDREKTFQFYRRGRYVEFNLVYDRGTRFGLQSGGRAESILVSLPPLVRWKYGWQPEPNSPESRLQEEFLQPINWLNHA